MAETRAGFGPQRQLAVTGPAERTAEPLSMGAVGGDYPTVPGVVVCRARYAAASARRATSSFERIDET